MNIEWDELNDYNTVEELKREFKHVIKILYQDKHIDTYKLDDHICRICDMLDVCTPAGMPGRKSAEYHMDYIMNSRKV